LGSIDTSFKELPNKLNPENEFLNAQVEGEDHEDSLLATENHEDPLGNSLLGSQNHEDPLGNSLLGSQNQEDSLGNSLLGSQNHEDPLGNSLLGSQNHEDLRGNIFLDEKGDVDLQINPRQAASSSYKDLLITNVPEKFEKQEEEQVDLLDYDINEEPLPIESIELNPNQIQEALDNANLKNSLSLHSPVIVSDTIHQGEKKVLDPKVLPQDTQVNDSDLKSLEALPIHCTETIAEVEPVTPLLAQGNLLEHQENKLILLSEKTHGELEEMQIQDQVPHEILYPLVSCEKESELDHIVEETKNNQIEKEALSTKRIPGPNQLHSPELPKYSQEIDEEKEALEDVENIRIQREEFLAGVNNQLGKIKNILQEQKLQLGLEPKEEQIETPLLDDEIRLRNNQEIERALRKENINDTHQVIIMEEEDFAKSSFSESETVKSNRIQEGRIDPSIIEIYSQKQSPNEISEAPLLLTISPLGEPAKLKVEAPFADIYEGPSPNISKLDEPTGLNLLVSPLQTAQSLSDVSGLVKYTPRITKTSYATGDSYIGYHKENLKHFEGTYRWANGRVYRGQWSRGKRHGYGTLEYEDGNTYAGMWKDGKKSGFGRMTYGPGVYYEGEWEKGKKSGLGTYVYGKDGFYEGEWKEGEKWGQGVYVWRDGRKYQGTWVNGEKNGRGRHTWPNGDYYDGMWKTGEKSGLGTYHWIHTKEVYEGCWRKDKRHGKGIYRHPAGYKYDGDWENDVKSGYGTYYFPDSSYYIGDWRNNLQHGTGFFNKQTITYKGDFKQGKYEGRGKLQKASGDLYIGDFLNGKYHGKGYYRWPNGEYYTGSFFNGKRHGKGAFCKPSSPPILQVWEHGVLYDREQQLQLEKLAIIAQEKLQQIEKERHEKELREKVEQGLNKGLFDDHISEDSDEKKRKRRTKLKRSEVQKAKADYSENW